MLQSQLVRGRVRASAQQNHKAYSPVAVVSVPQLHPCALGASSRMTVAANSLAPSRQQTTVMEAVPVGFLSLQGVLFDIDGTLTNSDPLHFNAFQEILSEVGFNGGEPIDEHFFRQHISGRHNPEIAVDFFPDWSEEKRKEFYEDKELRYRRMAASQLQPLPGLLEFLAWMESRGLRKAAVTNAPRENAEMMLAALGITKRFEALVLGEECERAKPFPEPYLVGLKTIGGGPGGSLQDSEVVVVEDSPSGIKAGVAAGLKVIGLTTGQTAEALKAAGAVWVVDDFRAIMAAIEQQQQAQQH